MALLVLLGLIFITFSYIYPFTPSVSADILPAFVGFLLLWYAGEKLSGKTKWFKTNQVSNEIIKFFNKKVYLTTIPRNIRLAEAPSHGLPVALYDSSSKGAEAYLSLAEEIMKRNGTKFNKMSKLKKIVKGEENE